MSENVYWVIDCDVNEGKLDDLEALMREMVAAVQETEPGALNYEWHLTEDGRGLSIYERYADSAAVLQHLGAFGERYAERFMASATPKRLVVYGAPSDVVKQALASMGAEYLRPFGGFARGISGRDPVRAAFDAFDEDGNGRIDLIEFRKLLARLGEEMEPAAAEALFDEVDSDETGLIGFAEFSAWWSTRGA